LLENTEAWITWTVDTEYDIATGAGDDFSFWSADPMIKHLSTSARRMDSDNYAPFALNLLSDLRYQVELY
jgi:hypothetical protein